MARKGSCDNPDIVNRGAWSAEEDKILINYVQDHGEGNWTQLSKRAGLKRTGKSCRLRYLNYLKPDIKRGNISSYEEDLIIRLHNLLGNRWSLIAGRLPGRTDNEIKNYWNTHLRKKIEKQNHGKIPRKSRVEPKGCTKNSLDINNNTTSTHAANYDSENMMNNVVNTTFLDSHSNNHLLECTPQDGHDNCSTLDICDKLIIPYEDWHCCNGCNSNVEILEDFGDKTTWWFDDSIGQAWHDSSKLIDFFPPDQVANCFSLYSIKED